MADEYRADAMGNLNDKPSYVVGIPLSPSTTLYVDHPPDSRNIIPPSDFGPHKKKNTSFQITSVTVQGSRLNNDECGDDSADDLDESNAEDLNSDLPSSSKTTEFDAEQSDENSNAICDDLSPCSGPIIIAKLPSNLNEPTINVGLSIGVSPTFPTIGPNVVSSGVTMMTSNATTPVSAQVPIINPLPDHWQHRFKVVKIVSSEPFKRGRWLCMDFLDPPGVHQDAKMDNNDKGDNHISVVGQGVTNSHSQDQVNNNAVAHVYEIPVQQSYPESISLTVGSQQPSQSLYGIILPVNNPESQVAMGQNVGIQTVPRDNANNVIPHNSVQNTTMPQNTQPIQVNSESPFSISQQNHVTLTNSVQPTISNSSMQPQLPQMPFSQPSTNGNSPESAHPALQGANNCESSFSTQNQVPFSSISDESLKTKTNLLKQHVETPSDKPSVRTNAEAEDQESSPTGAEKTTPPDVGRDLDPSYGSAASTGTSTVAIDNKIEQAMDLVKSHLMFAVREEVEVLKEKITELLERISQLEQENDILRANASPETLNQLNQSQNKIQGNSAHSPPQGAPPHSLPQQSSS